LPLSAPQLGIWFAQQLNPASAAYNIGEYIEIHGPVSPALFEKALRRTVAEAETLHLRIRQDAEGQLQCTGFPTPWSLPVIDLSGEHDARRSAEAWMQADLARVVDLAEGPWFRFALFKASHDRFCWSARYHHIVMDGLSMWLFARRVAHVYVSLQRSTYPSEYGFGSFDVLLAEDAAYRGSEDYLNDGKFWRAYLSDAPEPVRLGLKRKAQPEGFLRHSGHLPRVTIDRLSRIAESAGTGFAQVASAATAIFLHRLSGRTDVLFGLALANRNKACRTIPGMASNVLPLRLAIRPDMTFPEVIEQTKWHVTDAIKHQRFPVYEL